jgi:ankyrin repeat protein
MELFDLSNDVIRQIMIFYIDDSKVNQNKIKIIGSQLLNDISNDIYIEKLQFFDTHKKKYIMDMLIDTEYVSRVDEYGYTDLMVVCIHEMMEVALKLLNVDCKPDQVNINEQTALIYACNMNMPKVALKLLDLDCKPDHVNKSGDTALMSACENSMTEVALKLLDLDCNPNHVDIIGYTALLYACDKNMPEVALKILDQKCVQHYSQALNIARNNNMYKVVAKIEYLISK